MQPGGTVITTHSPRSFTFFSKKNDALKTTFEHFKVKKLALVEEDFLKEFVKVMKPFAKALDVLQNEAKMSIGCVLPVLTLLKEQLQELQDGNRLVHCTPLVYCLLDGIEKRFRPHFTDNFFNLAALSDPYFKLIWVEEDKKTTYTNLLKSEVQKRQAW